MERTKLPSLRGYNTTMVLLFPAAFLIACLAAWPAAAAGLDIEVGLQARLFAHGGQAGQDTSVQSASLRAEYVLETGAASRLVFAPFARLDSDDDRRTHADLREFFWSVVSERWEFSVGVKQVFWGVTEFNHLVDIINQTDLVENIDGEDKLGQPMAHLSLVRDWGVVDLFAMSGFRERTFPGADGRLRLPFVIDHDHARYASDDKEAHVDVAVRWSHQVGALELGLYHFNGTGRAPTFAVKPVAGGLPELVPEYDLIDQSGLDAQYLAGNWAFKLESIRRSGQGDTFHAVTAGTEYTLVGAFGTTVDLGLVAEYFHDERGSAAFDTLFADDYAVGLRLGFNDAGDSQALLGVIRDVKNGETVVSLEASRQVGAHLVLAVEGRLFAGTDEPDADDPATWTQSALTGAAFLGRDDYVEVELKWFF